MYSGSFPSSKVLAWSTDVWSKWGTLPNDTATQECCASDSTLPTCEPYRRNIPVGGELSCYDARWDQPTTCRASTNLDIRTPEQAVYQHSDWSSQASSCSTSRFSSSRDMISANCSDMIDSSVCQSTQIPYFEDFCNNFEEGRWSQVYAWPDAASTESSVSKIYSTEASTQTSPSGAPCPWDSGTEISASSKHARVRKSASCKAIDYRERRERRRAQNRDAQRSYRKRQASILASAQQEIEELKRALAESRRCRGKSQESA
jgi:hypothetical protein